MSIRRSVVALLDRPGGRTILGQLGTRYARWLTGADVEAYYDDFWFHRVGSHVFPDGPQFRHQRDAIERWSTQPSRYLNNAHDFWFRHSPPVEGEAVIDIGAGQGEDVLAFSQAVGKTGRVIAIEANPFSFDILQRFCRVNGFDNVTNLNTATMDQPGSVTIEHLDNWEEDAVGVGDGRTTDGIQVPAERLDDICDRERVTKVALIKMNIEGAERYALQGMERTLKVTRVICVACHDFRADRGDGEQFRTRVFTETFLRERGFQLDRRPDDNRDYVRDHVIGYR